MGIADVTPLSLSIFPIFNIEKFAFLFNLNILNYIFLICLIDSLIGQHTSLAFLHKKIHYIMSVCFSPLIVGGPTNCGWEEDFLLLHSRLPTALHSCTMHTYT